METKPEKFTSTKSEPIGPKVRRSIFDGFTFAYLALFGWVAFVAPSSEVIQSELSIYSLAFLGLMAFGAALSWILAGQNVKTLGEIIYAPPHRRFAATAASQPFYKTLWGLQTISTVLATVILGVVLTDISLIKLLEAESFYHAMRLFREIASPDWGILPKAVLKIIETIYIAFMATAIAVPVAFGLSFLMAKNVMSGSTIGMSIYATLRVVFNVMRSVEPVLWAIIFSIWVSFGPFAGMLALMIHSVASLARQYSEIVEGVEDGPIEGISATGASKLQVIWFAIVPQIILPYISFTIFRWDINVRMATILGFVGGGGIGTMLIEYQGQAQWQQVGTIIVVIAVVVWIMDSFSSHIREAIK